MLRPLLITVLVVGACEPGSFDADAPWKPGFCDAVPDLDPVRALPREPTWTAEEGGYGTGLGWADVNGDGERDLVVASGNDMQPGPVSVHLGAQGTLPAAPDLYSAHDAFHGHLAVGDVDGDGIDDVVVARYLGPDRFEDPGGVDLYLGGEDGLEADPVWSAEGFHTFSLALGDVDGDGDLDLAVAVGEPYYADPAPDRVYLADEGTFGTEPAWTNAPAHSVDVAFVDPDGDGDLDLVFARSDAPHARFDNDGGLGEEPAWEAPEEEFWGNRVDVGDVDGDGRPDLLVTDTLVERVVLYCGADWAPCWTRQVEDVLYSAAILADVDGDLDLDVVLGTWWGQVEVWPNEAGVIGDTRSWRSGTSSVIEALAVHDLDGAHEVPGCAAGRDLLAVPPGARVVGTDPPDAAVAGGYVSAPGPLEVRWVTSRQPDLAVTNWDPNLGTWLFTR